ncbi:LysE family transporter [Terribacillus saccharophilus]|uniref:Threonine/homoserine/homoserine lactone efflux protein n=1 Tax=Terribacillus saccharophilus TaxID=361277 RepID=A0AAX2EID0_9BACI|nr:LysE family transporter [Terribacillus goriensis]SEN86791.1 Threonine/homoserine/homoserine lactone efflux protein [Terribacillus saccharophilus]
MSLTAFFSYIIITSITPGPSNLLLMNESRKHGLKGAWKFNSGIVAGFILLGIIGSIITKTVYNWIPAVEPYLKVLGALYLLFIAYKIMFDKSSKEEDTIELPSFLSGFLFQLINIKSILYFITAMATFILPFEASISSVILYAGVTIIIGCLGLLLWAAFGSAFKKFFNKYTRSINLIMCLLLVFSAITIFK